MTQMIEVKTAELTGAALDWAVAQVSDVPVFQMGENWPGNSAVNEAARLGPVVIMDLLGRLRFESGSCFVAWSPSTDWSQGGPLIQHSLVEFTVEHRTLIFAFVADENGMPVLHEEVYGCLGETYLIAACRAIVLTRLGDTVQIPAELLP